MSDFIYRFVEGFTLDQPTILALHGTGGTEDDLIPLAQSFWPGAHILSPRGRVLENGMPRFFRRLAEGVFDLEDLHLQTEALADFVAASAQKHKFDASDVVAIGYSNGANIAASLLLTRPEILAGAILLRAMTPFVPEILPNLKGKPILLAAGRHDSMVPVANIENLARLFRESGADVTLRWEQASHGLTNAEIEAARAFSERKDGMKFNVKEMAPRDAYKLLTGIVVPRPIALVTSHNEAGLLNAAPFSFFNMVGSTPPLVALGLARKDEHSPKDTAANIRSSGEFVVNLVSEELVNAMNICATDFPSDISEIEMAKLETAPSSQIGVPRLAKTPAALECREHTTLLIGQNRVIIAEVVAFYIEDRFVDLSNLHVQSKALKLIGRMGGGGGYTYTSETFELPRISFDEWRISHGDKS